MLITNGFMLLYAIGETAMGQKLRPNIMTFNAHLKSITFQLLSGVLFVGDSWMIQWKY